MKKKFLNFALVVCFIIPCLFALVACGGDNGSPINVASANELVVAIENAKDGDVIKLTDDIVTDTHIVVDKKITLDLNGKTIYNEVDIWNDDTAVWSLISVKENGDLTIKCDGTLQAKENDSFAIDLRAENAKVTIENGTFVGNVHSVYVLEGELLVKGGNFSVQQKYSTAQPDEFVLNCLDANYDNGTAKIVVKGGSFKGFNPADNDSENRNNETITRLSTNYVADGYTVTDKDGYYTVVKEA